MDQPPPTAVPPAAGVRADWETLPDAVRDWASGVLGAPVVAARTQTGGFSPGVAARLTCAGGVTAFLKAVSSTANPDSPRLYRYEREVAARLPAHPAFPRLLDAYDADGWVALLFEDVPGGTPGLPWSPADLTRVLDTLTEVRTVLDPAPAVADDAAEKLGGLLARWAELAADPPADLDPWVAANLDDLAAMARTAPASGTALVHLDLRADNILVTGSGRVCLVDWAQAVRGPAWMDVVILLLEVAAHGGHDVDRIVAGHPLTRDVDPGEVTQVVLAVAGMFEYKCRQPAPPGLPTLRAFQRAYARTATGWLRRRL